MDTRLDMEQLTRLQGSEVYGSDGEKIGKIEEVYFDEATRAPEWVGIGTGFLRTHRVVVPVAGAQIEGEMLRVPYSKDRVKDSPSVSEDEITTAQEQELAAYYGLGYSFEDSESGLPEMPASGPVDVEASMATATPLTATPAEAAVIGAPDDVTSATGGGAPIGRVPGDSTATTPTVTVTSGTRLGRWTPSTGTTTSYPATETTRLQGASIETPPMSGPAAAGYAVETPGTAYASDLGGEVSTDSIEAMRGQDVYGSEGDKIGSVEEVYVDDATSQPEWLGIDVGFLGLKRVVVPFRSATPREDGYAVPFSKDDVKQAPSVDVDEIGVEDERELCTYFGLDYSHAESPTGMPAEGETPATDVAVRHRRLWGQSA